MSRLIDAESATLYDTAFAVGLVVGANAMREACIVSVYDSPWQPHVTQNIVLRLQALPIPATTSGAGLTHPQPIRPGEGDE